MSKTQKSAKNMSTKLNQFENVLYSQLQGFFKPGTPLAISMDQGNKTAQSTYLHEATHNCVTQGSSLGTVANLCGLVNIYDKDRIVRERANKYIRSYCNKSFWVQEGAATAAELLFSKNVELKRPRSYLLASEEILSIAIPICQRFKWENQSLYDVALQSIIQGIAMACLNPVIDDKYITAALNGDENIFFGQLDNIWSRYEKLYVISADSVVLSIMEQKESDSRMMKSTLHELIRLKYYVSNSLCKISGISHSDELNAEKLAYKFVPHLKDHIRVFDIFEVSFEETKIVPDLLLGNHILFPEKINGRRVKISNLSDIDETLKTEVSIIEVTSLESGGILFILHIFNETGHYLESVGIEFLPLNQKSMLTALLARLLGKTTDKSICNGVVVGFETVRDYHLELLNGVPLVQLPLFNVSVNKIEKVESLASDGMLLLQRLKLKDEAMDETRSFLWRVVLSATDSHNIKPMTPTEKAYAWVLNSGFSARIRWDNQYSQSCSLDKQ